MYLTTKQIDMLYNFLETEEKRYQEIGHTLFDDNRTTNSATNYAKAYTFGVVKLFMDGLYDGYHDDKKR